MGLNLLVTTLLIGARNGIFALNIFNQATLSKMPISNEPIEPFATAGQANIFLKHWMKYKTMQRNGYGFTITSGLIKRMLGSHH